MEIRFFVPGIPQPRGSKNSFPHSKTGKIVTVDTCKRSPDWMSTVRLFAYKAMKNMPPTNMPVTLTVVFYMPRPKNHFRANGTVRPTAPIAHTKRPDRGKLLRAIEDALTGIVYQDDNQVWDGPVKKIYGEKTGVLIIAEIMEKF